MTRCATEISYPFVDKGVQTLEFFPTGPRLRSERQRRGYLTGAPLDVGSTAIVTISNEPRLAHGMRCGDRAGRRWALVWHQVGKIAAVRCRFVGFSMVVLPFVTWRQSRTGLFCRRHYGGTDDGPIARQRCLRDRAQHCVHLQGQIGRYKTGRQGAWRALRAKGAPSTAVARCG